MLISIAITACGGGGSLESPGGGSSDVYKLSEVTMVDSEGGKLTGVDSITPGTVTVFLTKNGSTAHNQLITFSLSEERGLLFPEDSNDIQGSLTLTVLTDIDGKATVVLKPGNKVGAGTITATYISPTNNSLSESMNFDTDGDGAGPGEENVYAFSMWELSPSQYISSASPAILTVKLTINGAPYDNQVISFSLKNDIGVLFPESGTVLTSNGGEAKIDLKAGTVKGAGTVVMSYISPDNITITQEVNFESEGDDTDKVPNLYLDLTLVTPNTNSQIRNISQSSPGQLSAQIKSLDDDVAIGEFNNKLIQFSTEKTGVINPSLGTALTDQNGVASVTLLPASVEGAGIARATYTTVDGLTISNSYNFISAGDAPVDGGSTDTSISLTLKNAAGIIATEVSAASPLTVSATVTDSNGEPIISRVVSFGSTLGTFIPESGTALTDGTGTAILTLTAGTIEGAGEVMATFDSATSTTGFYTKGDVIVEGQLEADVSVKLLIDCPAEWSLSRNDAKLLASDCTEVSNISSAQTAVIYAEVTKKGSTIPLNGLIVAGTTSLGSVLPESGTALTDNYGIALLSLLAGTDVGAGQVSITAINTTSSTSFEIGAADIKLEIENGMSAGTSLSAGSTTVAKVTIKNPDDSLFLSPLEVQFSSGCASTDPALAILDDKVTSIGGIANATYRATGCVGTDTITATVITGGDAKTISTTVEVLESSVGSIEFVGLTQTELALKGTGGQNRKETSELTFRLIDENGNPVTQKDMSFELSTAVGGLELDPSFASTNNDGIAKTTVKSGNVPTTVVVKALYEPAGGASELDEQIQSVSSLLTISTGLPDNNSYTVSPTIFNSETLDYNGDLIDITVFLGDSFNNTVPDGTAVYMTTEGGAVGTIDDEAFNPQLQCTSVDGACALKWRAQNPRPFIESRYKNTIAYKCDKYFNSDAPCTYGIREILRYVEGDTLPAGKSVGNAVLDGDNNIQYLNANGEKISDKGGNLQWDRPLGGRFTVTSWAEGQESFIDLNNNGLFDFGEYYSGYDLTEVFKDHNENGEYDNANSSGCTEGEPDDPCSPENSDGGEFETYEQKIFDSKFTEADGKYNGLLCTDEAAQKDPGGCTKELTHVRRNVSMVMSGSEVFVRAMTPIDNTKVMPGCAPYTVTSRGVDEADPADDFEVTLINLEPSDIEGYCDVNSVNLSRTINVANSSDLVSSLPITIVYSDRYNNPPPFETTVAVSTDNGVLSGTDGFNIPNTSSRIPGSFGINISLEKEPNDIISGAIEVIFTTAKVETTFTLSVLD